MHVHRLLFALLSLLLLLLAVISPAQAQDMEPIAPAPVWTDPISRNSLSSAWGDLDDDGDLDLVVGTLGQGIRVFTNQAGALSTPTVLNTGATWNEGVLLGDLNGDGRLDLAVANGGNLRAPGQPNQLFLNVTARGEAITLAPADIAWADPQPSPGPGWATGDGALADFDGDGRLDMAFVNDGWLHLYRNRTAPGADSLAFTQVGQESTCRLNLTGFPTDLNALQIGFGDVNGDGLPDLAAAMEDKSVRVWTNDGQGCYAAPASNHPVGGRGGISDLAWADVDNDGDDELGLAVYGGENVILDNRGGALGAPVWSDGRWDQSEGLAWGDADGDGDLDLAIANRGPDRSHLYINDYIDNVIGADGGLAGAGITLRTDPAWSDGLAREASGVQWGDLDSDGDLDLAMVVYAAPDLVHENQTPSLSANAYDALLSDPGEGVAAPGVPIANDLAWGDVDNDGDLDLAIGYAIWADVNNAPQNIYWNMFQPAPNVVLENVDGALDPVPMWRSAAPSPTTSVAWGDMNADGYLDLAAGNQDGQVAIYRNDGRGSLEADASCRIDVRDDELYQRLQTTWGDDSLAVSDLQWWASTGYVSSVAWGDVNSDGWLDLAVGVNNGVNRLYLNDGQGGCPVLSDWLPETGWPIDPAVDPLLRPHRAHTYSVAFGDVDNDGDLDLAVGNHTGDGDDPANRDFVYLNHNGVLDDRPAYEIGGTPRATRSLAWGDVDGDGDLDLAAGIWSGAKVVFENVDGILQPEPLWESVDADLTTAVAWGDADGDGDLDLAAANVTLFSGGASNDVYYNRNGRLDPTPAWQSAWPLQSYGVAWGDVNGDGLPDLAVSNQNAPVEVNHGRRPRPRRDAVAAPTVAIDSLAEPVITAAGETSSLLAPADFYALAQLRGGAVVSVTYRLLDETERPVRRVEAFYSLNGTDWQPAIFSPATRTENLATASPDAGGAPHVFGWMLQDPAASAWPLGWSDNVRFRMVAYPTLDPAPGEVAGSYQQAGAATQTYPFRVSGSQVQVFRKGSEEGPVPVQGAVVYRLPRGQTEGATLLASDAGEVYRTNEAGLLVGRGELAANDRLMALAPITATHAYTLYLTSGLPNAKSVAMQTVKSPGTISLTVSGDAPLYLFNLDLSLEWDARGDREFMADLETAVQKASAILFDITNGQAALGDVRVHHNKERWTSADVVMYASNSIRPRAAMGGVVIAPFVDPDFAALHPDETDLPFTYIPGQIHMGPLWDPFGQSQLELQKDWWRAFAHELAHYLLFLPDDYLGVTEGALITVDCQGSFMTNAYDEERYGELLNRDGWEQSPDCARTVAAQLLSGRTDWETVQAYLPAMRMPEVGRPVNAGPHILPLNITRLIMDEDPAPIGALAARNYDLRDEGGDLALLQNAEVYLFKSGPSSAESEPTVSEIIPLGSTGSGHDRIKVRGARSGDRVCVFDTQNQPPRTGCVDRLNAAVQSIQLEAVAGWRPEITVSPISSRTLAITVTQAVTDGRLQVQVLPAYGAPAAPQIIDAPLPMTMEPVYASDALTATQAAGVQLVTTWTQTITLAHPAFEGFVRVWLPPGEGSREPVREAVTQYFLSAGWGPPNRGDQAGARGLGPPNRGDQVNRREQGPPNRGDQVNRRIWGPPNRGDQVDTRAWTANNRTLEAPAASGDGRVTIFNVDDLLDAPAEIALQALNEAPGLDPWLTPVGKVYRFTMGADEEQSDARLTMAFHYLPRDVPDGFEHALAVYFRPQAGGPWRKLETRRFATENMATAPMSGGSDPMSPEGLYALVAAVELPPLYPGWNLLAYTVPASRPVASALASIEGEYSVVYGYDPAGESSWRLFDPRLAAEQPALFTPHPVGESPTLAGELGGLQSLDYGRSYLIHVTATEPVTPVLAVPGVAVPAAGEIETGASGGVSAVTRPADLGVAPAWIIGEVSTPSVATANLVGQEIRAMVVDPISGESQLCGVATVQLAADNSCFYALAVDSAGQQPGCGAPGQEVRLFLGDNPTPVDAFPWDNRQLTEHALTVP